MIPIENLIFELVSLAFGIAILIKLWVRERFHFYAFLATVTMTTIVELFGLGVAKSYHYGEFLLFVPQAQPFIVNLVGGASSDFPLFIGANWAIIVYCLMRMGKRLEIPWTHQVFICGLVAVAFDLALDPLAAASRLVPTLNAGCQLPGLPDGSAEGVGYWVWCILPLTNVLIMGIPIQNFYGWYLVIMIYMAVYHAVETYVVRNGSNAAMQIALLTGAVAGAVTVYYFVIEACFALEAYLSPWWILAVLLILGAVALARAGIERTSYDMDWWAFSVVIAIILFCAAVAVFYMKGQMSGALIATVLLGLVASVLLTLWIMLGKRLLGLPYP